MGWTAVGFHGEGLVLVTREGAHYSTDSRYIEAARQEVQGAQVELVTRERGHLALAAGYLQEHGLKRVGFESGAVSVDALARYERALSCTLVPAQDLPDGLRASKDGEELAAMEAAQRITDEAFQAILNFIRPGQTEREVAARLVYELLRRGGERVSFDPIVAAGANGSKPHAVPGDTVIQPGMFVTMDFGCVWRGYCSDMTRPGRAGRAGDRCRRPDGDPGGGVWGGIFPQLRPLPGTGDPRVPQCRAGGGTDHARGGSGLRRAGHLSARAFWRAHRGRDRPVGNGMP